MLLLGLEDGTLVQLHAFGKALTASRGARGPDGHPRAELSVCTADESVDLIVSSTDQSGVGGGSHCYNMAACCRRTRDYLMRALTCYKGRTKGCGKGIKHGL